jgi:two-component system sensor histidine kinase AlgZ
MNHHDRSLRRTLHATGIIVLLWSALIALGALGSLSDNVKRGGSDSESYTQLLASWFCDHVLLIVLTCACHELFRRRPQLVADRRSFLLMYGALMVCFVPLQVLFQTAMNALILGKPVLAGGILASLQRAPTLQFFFEFTWATFTFTAIVAVCNWRDARERQQAWMASQNENFALRLELEQQRMMALRGQLNPHFLFNALNAISALVRTHDGKMALAGIGHLSDLLRYALQASELDHVSLADERQFVADYLALQKMRYGDRLQVHIVGDDDGGLAGEVPPLLLQPLIENALRHDLDCHEGPSDIRLAFGGNAERLTISVSNPLSAGRTTNPGLGLGLHHSRSRLQLAYGDSAKLSAGPAGGRFRVDISMPRHAPAA